MRIGANLILKKGRVCQSHHWKFHRPIGDLKISFETLTRYKVDEINIISLNYLEKLGIYEHIELLKQHHCSTPIVFGGGLNDENIDTILGVLPAERYHFCSAILSNQQEVFQKISKTLGKQSVVGVLPFKHINGQLNIYFPSKQTFIPLDHEILSRYENFCDEVLLYDIDADGTKKGFCFSSLETLQLDPIKVIISGGVTGSDVEMAKKKGLSAVYLDNSFLHYENGELKC